MFTKWDVEMGGSAHLWNRGAICSTSSLAVHILKDKQGLRINTFYTSMIFEQVKRHGNLLFPSDKHAAVQISAVHEALLRRLHGIIG